MSKDLLATLAGLAITSDDAPVERIERIVEVVEACAAAFDAETAKPALAEGLRLLDAAAAGLGKDGEAASTVAQQAHRLGRLAEQLQCPAAARAAYQMIIPLLSPECDQAVLGVVWHDIGDTWDAEGSGREALASYRTAAHYRLASDDLNDQLVTLLALARAEHACGTDAGCDAALDQGARLLVEAAEAAGDDVAGALAECARELVEVAGKLGRAERVRHVRPLLGRGELPARRVRFFSWGRR